MMMMDGPDHSVLLCSTCVPYMIYLYIMELLKINIFIFINIYIYISGFVLIRLKLYVCMYVTMILHFYYISIVICYGIFLPQYESERLITFVLLTEKLKKKGGRKSVYNLDSS